MHLEHVIGNEQLDAKASRRLARLLNPAPSFDAHLPGQRERATVEHYIAERFFAAHGARVHDFMPVLLTMGCNGQLTAATGIRSAAAQPLFLEQYLPQPVEDAVSQLARQSVARSQLAEIGNLVASQGGSSYLLFMVLTAILDRAGFEWVTFTATPQVRKVLAVLGLQTHVLCAADPARLTQGSAQEWGRYYATAPQVVAGRVPEAMAVLEQRLLYASVLALFRPRIEQLATVVAGESARHGTYTLAA